MKKYSIVRIGSEYIVQAGETSVLKVSSRREADKLVTDAAGAVAAAAGDIAGLDPVRPATPLSAWVRRVSAPSCKSIAYTSGVPSLSEMK